MRGGPEEGWRGGAGASKDFRKGLGGPTKVGGHVTQYLFNLLFAYCKDLSGKRELDGSFGPSEWMMRGLTKVQKFLARTWVSLLEEPQRWPVHALLSVDETQRG